MARSAARRRRPDGELNGGMRENEVFFKKGFPTGRDSAEGVMEGIVGGLDPNSQICVNGPERTLNV